jgi:proton-dependent oligopeptide transporter, POT family
MVMQVSGAPDIGASAEALKHPQKHPRGLYTLFFTEMWERASYYGMRALLVLFLAAPATAGGMGLDDKTAAAIYGIYTAAVYLFAMPGGWISDRLMGMKNAVFWGGCIITAGHFSMAMPWDETFYLGLVLIVLGTGLLKPCISSIVGELYTDRPGAQRDAGFSIYYMGINLGAILGSIICGWLGEKIGWHYGFAAAGIGMLLGLLQFKLSGRHLAEVGNFTPPTADDAAAWRTIRRGWALTIICTAAFCAFVGAAIFGSVTIDPGYIAANGSVILALLALAYFCYIYFGGRLDATEKNRMKAAGVLFFVAALFWAGFEQAGSSFNLFAVRYTDRMLFGWEMPASWLQSVNALFIIILAPFFAAAWVKLGARNLNPSSPVKFAMGVALLGLGFGVMALAAELVVQGHSVLPTWLVLTYLLHTMGELCLSPIGLSLVTKLAPRNFTAQMMGFWFMSSAIGNLMAGVLAGHMSGENLEQMPSTFSQLLLMCGSAALVLVLLRKPIQRWMGGVK